MCLISVHRVSLVWKNNQGLYIHSHLLDQTLQSVLRAPLPPLLSTANGTKISQTNCSYFLFSFFSSQQKWFSTDSSVWVEGAGDDALVICCLILSPLGLLSWTHCPPSSRAGCEEIFHRKSFAENHIVWDLNGMKSVCMHMGYLQQILSNWLGQWGKTNIVSFMQELWWRKMPPTSQIFFVSWLSKVNLYHHFLVITSF